MTIRSPAIGGARQNSTPLSVWSCLKAWPNYAPLCRMRPFLQIFLQYLTAFCSWQEAASDVVSCMAGCTLGRHGCLCKIWWFSVKQWANYLTLLPDGPVLHTYVQYLTAFCSRPETAIDVISGKIEGPIVHDKRVKFCDHRRNATSLNSKTLPIFFTREIWWCRRLGTNLIHRENAWFHGRFPKIWPISQKIHGRVSMTSQMTHG